MCCGVFGRGGLRRAIKWLQRPQRQSHSIPAASALAVHLSSCAPFCSFSAVSLSAHSESDTVAVSSLFPQTLDSSPGRLCAQLLAKVPSQTTRCKFRHNRFDFVIISLLLLTSPRQIGQSHLHLFASPPGRTAAPATPGHETQPRGSVATPHCASQAIS